MSAFTFSVACFAIAAMPPHDFFWLDAELVACGVLWFGIGIGERFKEGR